jgi:hypothetical protein
VLEEAEGQSSKNTNPTKKWLLPLTSGNTTTVAAVVTVTVVVVVYVLLVVALCTWGEE